MTDVIQDIVLPAAEVAVEKAINEHADSVVHGLIQKLVELCPIDIIDQVILGFEPKAKEIVKAEALKLAEKISAKV